MDGNLQPVDGALIRAITVLEEAPNSFVEGPTQERFDEARATAVAHARARVGQRLSVPLAAPPEGVAHGVVGNYRASSSWYATLRATLERAAIHAGLDTTHLGPVGATTARLVAGVEVQALPAGAAAPHDLFASLDDGWMLVAERPVVPEAMLADLLADLSMAYGAQAPVLHYGIRSALGPPPLVSEHPRLLIQLLGVRAVLFMGGEHPPQQQAQMQAGFAAFVPAGYSAAHLPLDEDSAHLDIALTRITTATVVAATADERSVLAMVAVVRSDTDDEASRRSLIGSSEDGWAARLFAPGGVHVIEHDGDPRELDETATSTVAVGGHRLALSPGGVELVAALADGQYKTAHDLADQCELASTEVEAALDALWRAGLLSPAPVVEGLRPNERLTQVASAGLGDPALIEAITAQIDPAAWRDPVDGEVFFHDGADIAVQPLLPGDSAAVAAQLQDIAAALNERFFAADIVGSHLGDPPLLVRARLGSVPKGPRADALGSDLVSHSTRKVTWVFVLTEADGGWVHLPAGSDAPTPNVGTLAAWVSSRPWLLTPTTSGERLFLIGRLHGPAFS